MTDWVGPPRALGRCWCSLRVVGTIGGSAPSADHPHSRGAASRHEGKGGSWPTRLPLWTTTGSAGTAQLGYTPLSHRGRSRSTVGTGSATAMDDSGAAPPDVAAPAFLIERVCRRCRQPSRNARTARQRMATWDPVAVRASVVEGIRERCRQLITEEGSPCRSIGGGMDAAPPDRGSRRTRGVMELMRLQDDRIAPGGGAESW
jgi:hypothetical protein